VRLKRRGEREGAGSPAPADVLDRAAALRADGRLLEAIDLLTEANRTASRPELERELVQLRHQAYVAGAAPGPTGAAPPPVRAGEPTGALPSVAPADLDLEALRAGLATGGCLLVPGLLPPATVAELVAGIDRALAAFDASTEKRAEPADRAWYRPFQPAEGVAAYRVGGRRGWVRAAGGVWTADSPRMLFRLIEVLRETGLADLIEAHLGERPAMSVNKCTLRRVPIDSAGEWHQDGAFLGESVRSLNVWIALDHCGRDAPTMDVVPRRFDHVVPTGTDGTPFDWAVAPSVVDDVAGAVGTLRPDFAPGDVLLFDHLFLHRTAAEPTMTAERHAIESWFFAPSTYPDGQIPLLF
jgi:hypothetical protein